MTDNLPTYVSEFQRWHSAAPSERPAIAAHQFATHRRSVLMPDELADQNRLPDLIAPNGKRFSDCDSVDLAEMIAWFQAIVKAGRDLNAAFDLRRKFESLAI